MHTGRLWRSHRRRDLRYFGRDWDYWPKRQSIREAIGFIMGMDPSIFELVESEPGELRSDGCGLTYVWHFVFDVAIVDITFEWQFPTDPTNDHGGITVTIERLDIGQAVVIRSEVDDCVEHDGDYRHFVMTDLNSEIEYFGAVPVDPPWLWDFWPWTYQDDPTEDS